MSKRFLMVALTLLSATALGSGVGCGSNTPSDNDQNEEEGTGGSGGGAGKSGGKGGAAGAAAGSSSNAGNAGQSKGGQGGSSGSASTGKGGASGGQAAGAAGKSSGSAGGAGQTEAPKCSASAAGITVIDDMSATEGVKVKFAPTFAPADCADTGTWFDYNSEGGTIEPAKFSFTALPSDPGSGPAPATDAGTQQGEDASVTDAGGADAHNPVADAAKAEASSGDAQAAQEGGSTGTDGGTASGGSVGSCVKGVTGPAQYSTSGMGFNFATVKGSAVDGGDDLPATVDASMYTGIQFQVYGGLSTKQTIIFSVPDKAETPGYNVCDKNDKKTAKACSGSFATFALEAGWHLIQMPFKDLKPNKYYGGDNETALDPSTLTQVQWQIQQAGGDGSAGVPFDLCVYNVAFY